MSGNASDRLFRLATARPRPRRIMSVLLGVLLAAGTALLVAPAATAATPAPATITCPTGTQTTTFTPPVTNRTRATRVHIQERYGCSSVPARITSAQGSTEIVENASCLVSAAPAVRDVLTYRYNTGEYSQVTFTGTTVVRAADGTTVVTSIGTVTRGLDTGKRATRVVTLPALDPTRCSTTGISSLSGPATLTIL